MTLVLSLCPLKQRHKNASKRRSVEGPRQRVGSRVSRLFSSPPAKRRSWTLLFPLCKPPSKLFRFFLHDRKKKKKKRRATTYAGPSARVPARRLRSHFLNRLAKVHTRVKEGSSNAQLRFLHPCSRQKVCFASLQAATAAKPDSRSVVLQGAFLEICSYWAYPCCFLVHSLL